MDDMVAADIVDESEGRLLCLEFVDSGILAETASSSCSSLDPGTFSPGPFKKFLTRTH